MPDNQTKEEWLELAIVADNPNATGTGVVIQSPGASKNYMLTEVRLIGPGVRVGP